MSIVKVILHKELLFTIPIEYKKSVASCVAVGNGSGGGGCMLLLGVADAVTELS